MKISFEWIKDYVDIDMPVHVISERLTMAGLEVVETESIGCGWDNIYVGEVSDIKSHPNADRLHLVTVNLGNRQITVVCGAPNVSLGQKIAFADLGAKLFDYRSGKLIELKPANIRGILSEGMVCSERELGISDSHEGIMVLSQEAPAGIPLVDLLGDAILDVDITPNRPDCLSVIGVAREIAAFISDKLRCPEIIYKESENDIYSKISIEILEPELCPRYCASLITGIQVRESPQWMQRRLLKSGMRPINNVVDVTNYVMLEYGQPLHAFNYDKIYNRKILVRRAKAGELVTSLDGIERPLNSDILVIADSKKAIAIAGIMGGLETEVTVNTNSVLIESANFDQAIIHNGSIDLKLSSEASIRFEKGLSMELPFIALKRATALMAEVTAGRISKGIVDVYPGQKQKQPILLKASEVKRILGMDLAPNKISKALESLGFEFQKTENRSHMNVIIPWWRTDINCSADLVEEVARIIGYDNIPTTMLSAPIPEQKPNPILDLRRTLRNALVCCGFQEVITYSLTNKEMVNKFLPLVDGANVNMLRVAKPMSSDYEYLRTSLRAGVLAVLARNQRHQDGNVRVFEIGKVFLPREGQLPYEKEMVCGILSGLRHGLYWKHKSYEIDFFTAKGIIEAICSSLKLNVDFGMSQDASFYPGRVAEIYTAIGKIGIVGELGQRVCQNFDLINNAFLFEIDLDKLLSQTGTLIQYQKISRYPSITRDIALIVSEQITYKQIHSVIMECPLIYEARPIDVYSGKQVSQGKKSIAVRIIYQSQDHTLRDQDVDELQQQILGKLGSILGATLRE